MELVTDDGYCPMSDLKYRECGSPCCRPDLIDFGWEFSVANETMSADEAKARPRLSRLNLGMGPAVNDNDTMERTA